MVGALVCMATLLVAAAIRARGSLRVSADRRNIVARYSSRLGVGQLDHRRSAPIATRFMPPGMRARMRRQLAVAGLADADSVEQLARRTVAFMITGAGIGVLIGLRTGGLGWLAVPGGLVLGFVLPDARVRSAGDKRTEGLRSSLPDALDLLQLCVASGLGLQAALEQVAKTQDGPVAAELGRVLQEMRLGISRSDAFASLSNRVRQEDLIHFAQAMVQVDRLGVSISSVLDERARDMREKRKSSAEEQAQKVSVKILGPLVACFLPALFLIVIGPAVLRLVDALG